MMRIRSLAVCLVLVTVAACDDDPVVPAGKTLEDFLPPVPEPDGTAQAAWAGQVASAEQLIAGPAANGIVGDYYLRNEKVSFIIEAPTRVIGVMPFGGNVIDGAAIGADGSVGPDHMGEIGLLYLAGRSCEHDSIEVLRDGAGGGPAVIRARGTGGTDDWLNLKGTGLLPGGLPYEIDPFYWQQDGVECATTYVLRPGAVTLEITWTLFNGGEYDVTGPLGMLADTGGHTDTWAPRMGYHRMSIDSLDSLSDAQVAPYDVLQGPGVAYGYLPRVDDPATPTAMMNVLGIVIMLWGAEQFLDILGEEGWGLDLPVGEGVNTSMDLAVGRFAADIEAIYQDASGGATTEVSGAVTYASGAPGAGARIGVFLDNDADGAVGAEDTIESFLDAAADGTYAGRLPPGDYLLRADVPDLARSEAAPLTVGATAVEAPALVLPDPAVFDYTITDPTGVPSPGRITVVGRHPAPLDGRVHRPYDRVFGVVRALFAVHGASAPTDGSPADEKLVLPAGGPYRVYVTRGPEWSVAQATLSPVAGETGTIEFIIERVVETPGYVATELHMHAQGSYDSIIPYDVRLRTLIAEGVEFFAGTDHDYISDYDPIIDELGLRAAGLIDGVPGVEATSFVWGHFNGYPMDVDLGHPMHGAVDWAESALNPGFDMRPDELWDALRARGAQVAQVNHPRASSSSNFMTYFDRAALTFDFAARSFYGVPGDGPVPLEWLNQPDGVDLFHDTFDAVEIWNGLSVVDTDVDGVPEVEELDLVMRDWLNFLAFGKFYTPVGNSDTHTAEVDPPGVARTLIRVPDDGPAAIVAGIDAGVWATMLGTGGTPRDIVVTDGPMLKVSIDGGNSSAIGHEVTAVGNEITFTINAVSPEWLGFDTLELFVNSTFDPLDEVSSLVPSLCFTTRDVGGMAATDPCTLAALGPPEPLDVQVAGTPGRGVREATVTFTLTADQVALVNRTGATGSDAYVVVRVRGARSIFPLYIKHSLDDANLDAVVAAGSDAELEAALAGKGVPAAAVAAPVFVDFDGGGYTAPFAP